MNFPVHVAAAVCAGQALIYARHRLISDAKSTTDQDVLFATACVLAGMVSHLLLDAVPHNNFLYDIGWLGRHFPHVIGKALQAPKILVITLPVFLIFWKYARAHWFLLAFALAGGLYPDIEKTAYLCFRYPRALVLFPWHSCAYSPEGWEVAYRQIVIAVEIVVYVAVLAAFVWLARRTPNARHIPGMCECAVRKTVERWYWRIMERFQREPQHDA